MVARGLGGWVKRVHALTTRRARARQFGGYAREAHAGLRTECARFLNGANG